MCHVINVEIKDNHEDATLGAFTIHEIVKEVCSDFIYLSLFNGFVAVVPF